MSHIIEEYTKDLPTFSREICNALDKIIHKACPEIQEGRKWGAVSYSIDEGLICAFYATKSFVTLNFFNGSLLNDRNKLFLESKSNVKDRSIRFSTVQEVTSLTDIISAYLNKSIENKKQGKKVEIGKRIIEIPTELKKILQKEKLLEKFESMSYSMKKEYIEWVMSAKKEETKNQRIEKMLTLIISNKGLYDKYK